jgi:hypothetical protein
LEFIAIDVTSQLSQSLLNLSPIFGTITLPDNQLNVRREDCIQKLSDPRRVAHFRASKRHFLECIIEAGRFPWILWDRGVDVNPKLRQLTAVFSYGI